MYVDGVETEKETFAEAFITTYLEEGEHSIRLSYATPGLAMGVAVSGICILAFVVTIVLKQKIEARRTVETLTCDDESAKME